MIATAHRTSKGYIETYGSASYSRTQFRNTKKANTLLNVQLKFHTIITLFCHCRTLLKSSGEFPLWLSKLILLGGDIEKNPGPLNDLTMITLNCRGLKKQNKFRQLINQIYKSNNIHKDFVMALQETHIETSNLSYIWNGSHIFTPGSGSKGGCITLLGVNMVLKEYSDIGIEGHVGVVESINYNDHTSYIIANIHAPCAHNETKINYFKLIKAQIDYYLDKYDNSITILMGDFNTAFRPADRLNTLYTPTETNIANRINNILQDLTLVDCWDNENNSKMTWRHGRKMSKLDRIRWTDDYSTRRYKLRTDWSYTISDHCAVIVNITSQNNPRPTRNVTRIDTRFLADIKLRDLFLKELDERVRQIKDTNLSPHGQIEFLKMSMRSIAIEIASRQKKLRDSEIKQIRADLEFWQKSYETAKIEYLKVLAMKNLDELTNKRDKYLTERGEYLCARMNSKWYQESERSTKYFLNLERSKVKKTEMQTLYDNNGILITDPCLINSEVELFYKNLYEKGDMPDDNSDSLRELLQNLPHLDQSEAHHITNDLTIDDLLGTLKTFFGSKKH